MVLTGTGVIVVTGESERVAVFCEAKAPWIMTVAMTLGLVVVVEGGCVTVPLAKKLNKLDQGRLLMIHGKNGARMRKNSRYSPNEILPGACGCAER